MLNFTRILTTLLLSLVSLISFNVQAGTMCTDSGSTTISGTLYDYGGAGSDYGNSEDCSFLIQLSGGGNITLSFSQFDTQNPDSLLVYDGTDATAPLLATLSGYSLPANLVSASGALFLRFTSNPGGTRDGFTDNWSTSGGCPAQNVADNYDSVSFSQNDGTQNWTTSWLEIGESDGPSAGIARANNNGTGVLTSTLNLARLTSVDDPLQHKSVFCPAMPMASPCN